MSSRIDSAFSRLNWGERTIALPGFNGKVSFKDDGLVSELATVGLLNEGVILAEHSLRSDSGRMSVAGAGWSLSAQNLSGLVAPWTDDWDVTAGTFSTDLQLHWQHGDSGWQLGGQSSFRLSELAGVYADTAFAGLSTTLDSDIDTASSIETSRFMKQLGPSPRSRSRYP